MSLLTDLFPAAETSWVTFAYALAVAGGAGMLAGLMYRAAALASLSFACVAASVVIGLSQNWSYLSMLFFIAVLLIILQIGYLMGAAIAVRRSRKKIVEEDAPIADTVPERDTVN